MTDKQIIIDGCDVADCEHINACDKKMKCVILQDDVCETNPYCEGFNCYYKQLKRKEQECETLASQLDFEVQKKECLEQECEELKAKFQDMKKSRDVALKEYNEEFEYKRQITVEHLEQKKELLRQLDQLKAENKELKKIINKAKNSKLDLKSFLVGEAVQNEYEQQLDQLKQILTEIKEIAQVNSINTCWTAISLCADCDEIKECDLQSPFEKLKAILQKISEVEDEHNG